MTRRAAAALAASVIAVTVADRVEASPPQRMTGASLVAALRQRPVTLTGTVVNGTVDFRALGVVDQALTCRRCTFTGAVVGPDVQFRRAIDLRGSEFAGSFTMPRASFVAPAMFGGPDERDSPRFSAPATFSLASFADMASFENARFERGVTFTSARFGSDVVFAHAAFRAPAGFRRAVFTSATDFRSSSFSEVADFTNSEFRRRADFNESQFHEPGLFTDARFSADGVFLGSVFVYSGSGYGAAFNGVATGGDLVFDLATFRGPATFRRATAGGSLTFSEADLDPGVVLEFEGVRAGSLSFELDDVDRVEPGDREEVLRLVESSAKADGDLGIANDAHYRLQVISSRERGFMLRALDFIFYRWGAGYFVRPLRPLAALTALAGAVSLLRVLGAGPPAGRTRLRRAWAGISRFAHELLDTLALVVPAFGSARAEGREGRRLEIFVYRVLIVCALIGLANSNPTMRQMFDALV